MEPRKVVEEEGYPQDRFAQQVKKELDLSISARSGILKVDTAFLDSSISSRKSSQTTFGGKVKRSFRAIVKAVLFALLCLVLLAWNYRLFEFGEFQMDDMHDRVCMVVNRFDFSEEAWAEEQLQNSKNNLKQRSYGRQGSGQL